MTMISTALEYVRNGYYIIPLIPSGERINTPSIAQGTLNATNDESQVVAWWTARPNDHIGIVGVNCIILDLDVKNGKNGIEDYGNLVQQLGSQPDGPKVLTGGGGQHLYFKRPVDDILGQVGITGLDGRKTGIDIRIGNQYVVAPPSVHKNGQKYEYVKPLVPVSELPPLTPRFLSFLPRRKTTGQAAALPTFVSTDDQNVWERCLAYVRSMPYSISGQVGHSRLLDVCNVIFWGFNLSHDQGWPILLDYNNNQCSPQWNDKQLEYKFNQVFKKPPDMERGGLAKPLEQGGPEVIYHKLADYMRSKKESWEPLKDTKEAVKDDHSILSTETVDKSVLWLDDSTPVVRWNCSDNEMSLFNTIGLMPENLITIGGAPGAGKSALINQLVFNAVELNPTIKLFIANVEMSFHSIFMRELARRSHVPLDIILNKTFDPDEYRKIKKAAADFRKISDRIKYLTEPFNYVDVITEANDWGANLIVIDYLQRFNVTRSDRNMDTKDKVREGISMLRGDLMKTGKCCVIASALSRGGSEGGRSGYSGAGITSFRDSSEIEYGSDKLYILSPQLEDRSQVMLSCVKAKNEKMIDIPMRFFGEFQEFKISGEGIMCNNPNCDGTIGNSPEDYDIEQKSGRVKNEEGKENLPDLKN